MDSRKFVDAMSLFLVVLPLLKERLWVGEVMVKNESLNEVNCKFMFVDWGINTEMDRWLGW